MKRHTVYVVADRTSGDLWPEWHYRRKAAREYASLIFRETGYRPVVVKMVPATFTKGKDK